MTPTTQHLRHPYPMHANVSAGQTLASRHGQGSDPINFCLDLVYKNLMGSDPVRATRSRLADELHHAIIVVYGLEVLPEDVRGSELQ